MLSCVASEAGKSGYRKTSSPACVCVVHHKGMQRRRRRSGNSHTTARTRLRSEVKPTAEAEESGLSLGKAVRAFGDDVFKFDFREL
jgi:hypothetical protein